MKFDAPNADELALVFDAWANSFRKSPWAGCVPNHLWDQVSRECASGILSRGARIVVGVVDLPDGGRRVACYSVSEPGILHWLFVKRDYRGIGWGTALLHETFPTGNHKYTHRTRASARFLGPRFTWDPVPARIK